MLHMSFSHGSVNRNGFSFIRIFSYVTGYQGDGCEYKRQHVECRPCVPFFKAAGVPRGSLLMDLLYRWMVCLCVLVVQCFTEGKSCFCGLFN